MSDDRAAMAESMRKLLRQTDIGEDWIFNEISQTATQELVRVAATKKKTKANNYSAEIERAFTRLHDVRMLTDDLGNPHAANTVLMALSSAFTIGVLCRSPTGADRLLRLLAAAGGAAPRSNVERWRQRADELAVAVRASKPNAPRSDVSRSVLNRLDADKIDHPSYKQIDNYLAGLEESGKLAKREPSQNKK